ncbi:hypothetical protein [Pareuzebyella sediminis]|uniref:hypothetical protein n=1 Tax=Pareuzebyella sediminis TaxID=2607998 RepID=UPI0011EE7BF7|nr:hypothetical protein [Pareuzebyella sediminis]
MEEQYFNEIRERFCLTSPEIRTGKMMRSEAITYQGKVFAFFSRKKRMVFKLGKEFDPDSLGIDIQVFNPFKNRGALHGWFEVPFTGKEQWEPLTKRALGVLKNEL